MKGVRVEANLMFLEPINQEHEQEPGAPSRAPSPAPARGQGEIVMTDSLLFWNDVALEAHRAGDPADPPQTGARRGARAVAIVHLAMYDAYVAVARPADFGPHLRGLPTAPAGASVPAAIAGAAHEALTALFPAQRATFDLKLAEAGLREDDPGERFGRAVASALLEDRSGDPDDGEEEEEEKERATPPPTHERHRVDPGVESSIPAQGFLGPFWSARMKRFAIIARGVRVTRPFDNHNHKAFRVLRAVRRQGFGPEPAPLRRLPGVA
jgi:vanadium chloroperoxidase